MGFENGSGDKIESDGRDEFKNRITIKRMVKTIQEGKTKAKEQEGYMKE
jgi:hypothetical protein